MDDEKIKTIVLDAYFDNERDGGRFTSQDICDNLRDTITLSPYDVTVYMVNRGYELMRRDDRLVWGRL